MSTNLLKKVYEKLPKGIKFLFSPIFIRLMVKHPIFIKTWKELDNFEKLSKREQNKIQFERLKELMIYSYENVDYYKELFDKYDFNPYKMRKVTDIEVLPILEKDEIIKLGNKLFSKEKIKHYKTTTGGSSGQNLTILLDKDSIYKERAFVTHYISKYGYDPLHSKTVAFWGHNKDNDYYYSPLKNEIVISPFKLFKLNDIDNVVNNIKKFKATYIMGYPSAIYFFVKLLDKNNIDLKIERVIYYAENMNSKHREYIEKKLNTTVISYYGLTERTCFAEIYSDDCIFNNLYGYTELIPTDIKNEYRVVSTGFLSKKMPLIRYGTDDIIKVRKKNKYELIGHKKSDVFLIAKNGQKIFKGALNIHAEYLKKVKCYQFVQNEIGFVELHILEIDKLSEKELLKLKHYLNRRCEGLLDIEIKIVDYIKFTKRGKHIWAINNIKDVDLNE